MLNGYQISVFISFLGASFLSLTGCETTQAVRGESPSLEQQEADQVFVQERTAELVVKGITCPFCVQNIEKQLAGISGVDRVHVDLSTGRVRALLNLDEPATQGEIVSAIEDSGFTLDSIEMP